MEPSDVSDRSRGVALCLGISIGVFGAHRFYTGKVLTGILQLGTVGGLGLWWLYDMILIASGEFRDVDEKRVRRWWETSSVASSHERIGPQMEAVLYELDGLRSEMGELGERVDFMERMLTRVKERDALPPG